MAPRRILSVAVISLILILIGASAFADQYTDTDSEFRATGTVVNIDTGARVFDLIDSGDTFTVMANRAVVQLESGKLTNLNGLKDSVLVRVIGEQLSARTITASKVIVLDESPQPVNHNPNGYHPNDRVELEGAVTSVQPRYDEIDISTRSGNYTIMVRQNTVIRRYIYVTDINDINENDNISVSGTVTRDGRIVADRVQISSGNSRPYPAGKTYRPDTRNKTFIGKEDLIEGVITYPAASFDRTFAMDTKFGERKVDVPKNAEVLIDHHTASLHDLGKGSAVRVIGHWDGRTMVASTIETIDRDSLDEHHPEPGVYQPVQLPADQTVDHNADRAADHPAALPSAEPAKDDHVNGDTPKVGEAPHKGPITGRITSIDYNKFELTIDYGLKDTEVNAVDAPVLRNGSTRRFSDLKKGDKIEVAGEYDGNVFKASSVDIVE